MKEKLTRREFLKGVGKAVAGAALWPGYGGGNLSSENQKDFLVLEQKEEETSMILDHLVERVLGGAEGELLTVVPAGEPAKAQKVLAYALPDGGKFFALTVYPEKLVREKSGEIFWAQFDTAYDCFYYPGTRRVLLNLVPSLPGHPEALPFVNIRQTKENPLGSLDFLSPQGQTLASFPLFEELQPNEKSLRFNEEKGVYEFLDSKGKVFREKQVFFEVPKLSPTPVAAAEIDSRETLQEKFTESEKTLPETSEVWSTPQPKPQETPVKVEGEVICTTLNVREKPWGKIIGYLENGARVSVIGYAEVGKGRWYQIELADGRQAWISGNEKYVKVNGRIEAVPEVENASLASAPVSETVILPVPIDAQDLPLSCESSAAAMVASYVYPNPPSGYKNWEEYFIRTIPPHCNPHRGFRGGITGLLSTSCEAAAGFGYGVYAEPVAEALNKAGIPARVEYGVDYKEIARLVGEGNPVIVWVSGRNVAPSYEKDPETGQVYPLLLGEHVWVVIGVSEENGVMKFLVNDPWKGQQFWVKNFPNWDVFNGMRVVVYKKRE